MYQLVKNSAPGWVKGFQGLDAIAQELHKHICIHCQDVYGTDLEGMLASDCGAEYGVEGLAHGESLTGVHEAVLKDLKGYE